MLAAEIFDRDESSSLRAMLQQHETEPQSIVVEVDGFRTRVCRQGGV
jgi:hypothetical protein